MFLCFLFSCVVDVRVQSFQLLTMLIFMQAKHGFLLCFMLWSIVTFKIVLFVGIEWTTLVIINKVQSLVRILQNFDVLGSVHFWIKSTFLENFLPWLHLAGELELPKDYFFLISSLDSLIVSTSCKCAVQRNRDWANCRVTVISCNI